jgi:hypothetical protein
MEWDDLSPEQQRRIEADEADLERQLIRVGVDLRAARPHMHELEAPTVEEIAGDESSEAFVLVSMSVDQSGILKTLRELPDGAGTSAFVAAYNAGHPDWRDARS